MTSKEIYKRYLIKSNKNDSNEGISIPIGHFVLIFNSERLRWYDEFFETDIDDWKRVMISDLLVVNKSLKKVAADDEAIDFEIPSNFYRESSTFSIVDKEDCKGVKIFNFEKNPLGLTAQLADDFSRPQFDYEETTYIVTKNKMRVYFDDFEIKRCYLSYYSRPIAIDIEGYTRFDGTASTDTDTDLNDQSIEEILDRVVLEVARQQLDPERFQLYKERISTEP